MASVAGADINEINAMKSLDDAREKTLAGQALFANIESGKKPVIAAINGVCLGGGNELAMSCCMRVASDRARSGQPEINLGLLPGWGGTQRLPRIVGKGKTYELLMTGDMLTAQEAKSIGLVNRVVPAGDVIKESMGLAKKIAAKSAVPSPLSLTRSTPGQRCPCLTVRSTRPSISLASARPPTCAKG